MRRPAGRRAILLGLAASLPAAAQEAPLRGLVGQSLVAFAAHPAVAVLLRNSARGRQQLVYDGLRLAGPPVYMADEHWLVGWARQGRRGLFMAFEVEAEQLVLFLLDDGRPLYLSPRSRHWPAPLAAPFADFTEGLIPPE